MEAIPTVGLNFSTITYFTPNHMGDLHEVVINNVCKVVSWETIILNDYLIINHIVIKDYFAVDHIFELCFSFRDFHSDDKRFFLFLFF
jgi:hypothetical protein